jgi:LysR family transcriptional regulator, pca operon transcriptional activator
MDARIKLRHLTCFLEVVRQKSVVGAADILCVSQPAVSKTLADLEQIVGVQLFNREQRRIGLTTFGEMFLPFAGASVSAIEHGIHTVAAAQERPAPVNVGTQPAAAALLLPHAVNLFKRELPETRIRVISGETRELLAQLRRGELDLVVGAIATQDLMVGLAFEYLYSESIVAVVRPGHPLAQGLFDMALIPRFPIITPTEKCILRPAIDLLLAANGICALPNHIETTSMTFALQCIAISDAIWFISRGVVADKMAREALVQLPIGVADTSGPVGVVTRVDAVSAASIEPFLKAVRNAAAGLIRDGNVPTASAAAARVMCGSLLIANDDNSAAVRQGAEYAIE